MSHQCSVCNEKVAGDLLVYVQHTEVHIVDVIKKQHPEWKNSQGLCQKCLDYYRNEMKGTRH